MNKKLLNLGVILILLFLIFCFIFQFNTLLKISRINPLIDPLIINASDIKTLNNNDLKLFITMDVTNYKGFNEKYKETQDLVFIGVHLNQWLSVSLVNDSYCLYIRYDQNLEIERLCIGHIFKESTNHIFKIIITEQYIEMIINDSEIHKWDNISYLKDFEFNEPVVIGSCVFLETPRAFCYSFNGVIKDYEVYI